MTPKPHDRDAAAKTRSVTPERFARVRAIFEAALERRPFERRAFVDGACVGDEAMRRDVLDMLSAEAKDDPLLDQPAPAPSSSTPEEGRFPAGTVLAGRYRILGLLGTGGMGEVYRAHDLILNQPVALKFLTPGQLSEAALLRFRNEVRIARQVSHPHVCRVYDLGMVEGLHFLSMEYIDGEDLASLLRRIGRLPPDKALELTRKICAGLAAAHDRGVLHRDLKPANIMIDSRGQPRITDFGLAGLSAEIPLSDLRSGTPAYMSPEQKAGKDVTVRSDIYALGLVLHEMFTGRRREESSSSPTELVKDLDPGSERLILRCLEEDPKRRPASALAVAMALPGGDPIAAALAAGETPSPEMVAASQEKEGFTLTVAVACLATVVVTLVAGIWLSGRIGFLALAPLPHAPEVLAFQAQQLLHAIGYTEPAAASAHGFSCCDQRAADNLARYAPEERPDVLASHRPPAIAFWYREHRQPFEQGIGPYGGVTEGSPSHTDPGMRLVRLDATGRLIHLHVQPWTQTRRAGPPDWPALFAAAGLDTARFSELDCDDIIAATADSRRCWIGSYAEGRREVVRVTGASWRDTPVWFDAGVWPDEEARPASPDAGRWTGMAMLALLPVLLVMAWRNWRLGRTDWRGAALLTAALLVAAHDLIFPVFLLLVYVLFILAGYVAIEPHVRRYWPDALISWSRVTHGHLRNPLVASHVLVGVVVAMLFGLLAWPVMLLLLDQSIPAHGGLQSSLSGTIGAPFRSLSVSAEGAFSSVFFIIHVVLARLALRRLWLADVVAMAVFNLLAIGFRLGSTTEQIAFATALFMLPAFVWIWLMRRFGFLTIVVLFVVSVPVIFTPLAPGWLLDRVILLHAIPVAIALWAVWVIASPQSRPAAGATE